MSDNTAIEWTDATWNPITGCTKISRGCDNCYAERFSERFRGVKGHPFEYGFDLRLWPDRIEQPRRWQRPRRIFVNSMSDLFHKDVPASFIARVFETMESVARHTYQVLTKRSSLMREFVNARYAHGSAAPNIWLGVSVEDRGAVSRIAHLQRTRAAVRFLSIEPLIGPVGAIDLQGIHWVIVGGESGPSARAMQADWVREVKDQCVEAGIPFFFKQWGGVNKKRTGRVLDGRTWDAMPETAAACS